MRRFNCHRISAPRFGIAADRGRSRVSVAQGGTAFQRRGLYRRDDAVRTNVAKLPGESTRRRVHHHDRIHLIEFSRYVHRPRKGAVRRGGRNVSQEDIRRRFARSCANFWQIHRKIADYWYVVYNSSGEFKHIVFGEPGAVLVRDQFAFRKFLRLAGENVVEDDD